MDAFPQSLRSWRRTRRLSQLELALEAAVSARHISFLETGRARPSRDMIARLGDALNLPLAARNQLLTHAGFAARYPKRRWDDAEMAPIRAAVTFMLRTHDPFPAIAIDRLWTVVQMNCAAERMFAGVGIGPDDSLLELFASDVPRTVIENWPEVAYHTAQRLRTESLAQGGVTELDRVADHLAGVAAPPPSSPSPVVPTVLRLGAVRLSLFTTIAQFGTAEDVTLDDLKVELFFPADTETERALRAMDPMAP